MSSRLKAWVGLCMLALGLTAAAPASAFPDRCALPGCPACVPPPGGVFGLPGPPDWTAGGFAVVVDDPRWHGSRRETFPDDLAGGTPDSAARLVQAGGSLFLQIQALADATPGNTSVISSNTVYRDSVYVAFAAADLSVINVVRVGIDSAGATSLFHWTKSGGAWNGGPGGYGWLTAHTAWLNATVSGLTIPWTINFKINTAAVPGAKLWYGTSISLNSVTQNETYAWPERGGFVNPTPPDTSASAVTVWGAQFDAIGDPNGDASTADSVWGDYTTAAPPAVAAECGGVSVEPSDIGTTNSPPYKINTDASNTFKAQLTTGGGASLPAAGDVKARFRLANWGMTIGVDGTFTDIPGGAYTDNRTNTAAGLIQFSCPFVGPDSCPPLPAGAPTDQCLLVELQAANGPISFIRDSAWRNMMFAPASVFQHTAEISLKGLAVEATPRDVYIYVQAHNMPAQVDQKPPSRDATGKDPNGRKDDPYLQYRLEGLNPVEQRIVQGGPVYEVRGYRDTGKGTGGVQLLKPMVPYGYMVDHTGALVGWQHDLKGAGTTVVTTVIPDVLYKISVLPGGKATIIDTIQAFEKWPGPGPVEPCPRCCCDIRSPAHESSYLAATAFAVAILASRRRKRAREGKSASGAARPRL